MLKEGYKVQQGLEEAVYRNIQATMELGNIVRTSFGPNGKRNGREGRDIGCSVSEG
jgi:T-complex protein 1 subunit theta